MGDVSDIGDLLGKAIREKRMRLVWAMAVVSASAITTTAGVSWKMSRYVAQVERSNDELKGEIRVLAKKIEEQGMASAAELKDIRRETQEARSRADTALLLAQLRAPRQGVGP